jgi:pimeloyl-ACP methyl ester carboxylesterase
VGPPVVLLHGIGRSIEDWTEQHELLRGQHRVYSVDLPGHGKSEPLAEPYTLAALARFVADFLGVLDITEPAHLVGHSLGGAVATQLAVHAPDRVASLALVTAPALDARSRSRCGCSRSVHWAGSCCGRVVSAHAGWSAACSTIRRS